MFSNFASGLILGAAAGFGFTILVQLLMHWQNQSLLKSIAYQVRLIAPVER